MAKAASDSHAIPTNALSPKTSPFSPTNCSVDKFVSNNDPATMYQDRALPPVKYSSVALSLFFIFLTIIYVKIATAVVATINDIIEIVFKMFSPICLIHIYF